MTTDESKLIESRFRERLKGVQDDDPLWSGFLWLVGEMRESSVLAVAAPRLTPDDRAYNSGRVAFATDLEQSLREAVRDARMMGTNSA